jgi:hypothetical protein
MRISARYVGDVVSQVHYTTLLHAILCKLYWRRCYSSSVNNAASCESVHVMLQTMVIKFSKQRCFIRLSGLYVADVGKQVQYRTLLHATLSKVCWRRW